MTRRDRTFGPDYDVELDGQRIGTQMSRVRSFMLSQAPNTWRTLGEIGTALNYPEASISAQLRHLRKERFGSYEVLKRRREPEGGTWEYRIRPSFTLEP